MNVRRRGRRMAAVPELEIEADDAREPKMLRAGRGAGGG